MSHKCKNTYNKDERYTCIEQKCDCNYSSPNGTVKCQGCTACQQMVEVDKELRSKGITPDPRSNVLDN